MKPRFVTIIAVILLLLGSLNYYIGLRLWQWVSLFLPLSGWGFVILFGIISFSFVIARIGGRWLPRPVAKRLTKVGSYWFLVLLYAPPLLLLVEVVRLLN